MLVAQFSWVAVLWFNHPLNLPLGKMFPLKYSTGYNHDFASTTTTSAQSDSAPFTSEFRLNPSYFFCNFNFVLLLQLFALVAVIATYCRLQLFLRRNQCKNMDRIPR